MGQRQRYTSPQKPEFWSFLGGKRTRRTLVYRISLPFEIRRERGARSAELWIYGDECIRRWKVPTDGFGGIPAWGRLASELEPLPIWRTESDLPRWDQGRCVIDVTMVGGLRDAMEFGKLSLTLHGELVQAGYRLERTPMSVVGKPQWLIWKVDLSPSSSQAE